MTRSLAVKGAVIAGVASAFLCGCHAASYSHSPYPAGHSDGNAPGSSPGSPDQGSSRTGNGTGRSMLPVHSPGAVDWDETLSPGQCHARVIDASSGEYLPDPSCTPGAYDPAVTQANIGSTICAHGWTVTVRPPAPATDKAKENGVAAYSETWSSTTEEDHLVPLELGGANSISNLWPEPNRAGAGSVDNPKDRVENALRRAVCDGRVPLNAARQAIASNWTTALQVTGAGTHGA